MFAIGSFKFGVYGSGQFIGYELQLMTMTAHVKPCNDKANTSGGDNMATPFERVDELRRLLRLNQIEFAARLDMSKQVYTMWKSGQQDVVANSLALIADRWHVSLDSLWGRPGTSGVEPAPDLRSAQEALLLSLGKADYQADPGEPVIQCYRLLVGVVGGGPGLLPTLSDEAWADWLGWSMDEWDAALLDPRLIGDDQIAGAAMLCGWYDGRRAWVNWFRSGHAAELRPGVDRVLRVLADFWTHSGGDAIDLRRVLQSVR
jgi:transcriptional regulator with XRE-family HTH domain